MRAFLASLPLDGKTVVVVGGGEQAVAKARLMASTPAHVRWFTPDVQPAASEIPDGLEPQVRTPHQSDFARASLVFIALADEGEAERLAALARTAGAWVNVVDRPAFSDFQTPALVDRGEVTVGIATAGSAPILAREVRARVEGALPQGLDLLGRLAGEIRETVKAAIPEFLARRRFWERAFRGPAVDLAAKGDEAGARRAILKALNADAKPQGSVALVGAGPGDPELLTLKALRVLQDADVVVHDRLVSSAVLDRARRDARRIDVGKAKGRHPTPQDVIETILIEEARKGHRVVRLKGGDPFVFGRGGEELEALRAAGVEAEVVPGITAAIGCAASARLPLTHRDHAQAVTFVTGRPKRGGPDVDWAALSSPEHTLAVYMGAGEAGRIADTLIEAGRDPGTPVAIVVDGTLPGERVVKGSLAELGLLTAAHAGDDPALLFIGRTAAFAEETVAARSFEEVAA
jgi:uroporphyrin-III C-methyltransferase/precorrin-2 dehydrogenase/sirohydrochlorin ferrochelatase